MSTAIYKSSDRSSTNADDLTSWLSTFTIYNPEYSNRVCDEVTGVKEELFETKDYLEMKAYY